MKKSLVFLLSFLLISSVFSDTKTGWGQDGLKGKVKERTVIQYAVTNNSGESVKRLKSKSTDKYDERGIRVGSVEYDFEGITILNVYNENGNMIQRAEPPISNADETLKSKSIFKYDDSGNKAEEARYNANGDLKEKLIYKYDDNGKKAEEEKYNGDGALINKSVFKYDESGRNIGVTLHDATNKTNPEQIIKYDDKGNKEIAIYDANGNLRVNAREKKTVTKVDGVNHIIKLDDNGNETENSYYLKGIPLNITETSYTYY